MNHDNHGGAYCLGLSVFNVSVWLGFDSSLEQHCQLDESGDYILTPTVDPLRSNIYLEAFNTSISADWDHFISREVIVNSSKCPTDSKCLELRNQSGEWIETYSPISTVGYSDIEMKFNLRAESGSNCYYSARLVNWTVVGETYVSVDDNPITIIHSLPAAYANSSLIIFLRNTGDTGYCYFSHLSLTGIPMPSPTPYPTPKPTPSPTEDPTSSPKETMFIGDTTMSWSEADAYCKSFERELLSIHDNATQKEAELLCATHSSTGCWIGLTIDWSGYPVSDCEWSDGSQNDYGFDHLGAAITGTYPWGIVEPNDYGFDEDCVCLRWDVGYRWNDVACSNLRYPICNGMYCMCHVMRSSTGML